MADSITCPKCGRISHHPMDVEQGYCGFCHDWTTPKFDRLTIGLRDHYVAEVIKFLLERGYTITAPGGGDVR